MQRVLLALLAVLAGGLLLLHQHYPLPYIKRVLVMRDSDFEDIHRFPFHPIAAPDSASALPVALDDGVRAAFEAHPEIENLDEMLAATESTAFLVLQGGRLVFERYLQEHDATTMQNSFSVSKSVASALVGLALRDGHLQLDQPITRTLPELAVRDPRFAQIHASHLLQMTSGIRYDAKVGFPFFNGDDPLIYYHPDLASIVLGRTSIESPPAAGSTTTTTRRCSGFCSRAARGVSVSAYLERELWAPLGAEQAAGWTTDERGMERMESGFFACGRDLARFGLLYLNEGRVGGRQLLPEGWVEQSTRLDEPMDPEKCNGRTWSYGLGWWLVPRASGRPDFAAIGRYGQFVYVSPQFECVFVRCGTERGEWGDFDWTELFFDAAERLGGQNS